MVWWWQNFSDRGAAPTGSASAGETRVWSETLAGSLAWKELAPPCTRTPEASQVSPVPLWVHPGAPASKFSVRSGVAAVPALQSPGAGRVEKLRTAEKAPVPQTLPARTRQ